MYSRNISRIKIVLNPLHSDRAFIDDGRSTRPSPHSATLRMGTSRTEELNFEDYLSYDDGIEVVSPGELQRERDYIAKRQQYQSLGIPEYWIVDPEARMVTVLELQGTVYAERGAFRGSDREALLQSADRIISPLFSELALTVEQVL